ncbi:unnamed protein product [Parajaminaea phylloscopi]
MIVDRLAYIGALLCACYCQGVLAIESAELPLRHRLAEHDQKAPQPPSPSFWTIPGSIPQTTGVPSSGPVRPTESRYTSGKVHRRDPRSLAVQEAPFLSRDFAAPFAQAGSNETAHFQVYHDSAESLLGDDPKIVLLVKSPNTSYHFAHEAPVYFPDEDSLYWCSNAGTGGSNLTVNNKVFRFSDLSVVVHRAKAGRASYRNDVEEVLINSDDVQMTNGGTNYGNHLLLVNQGRGKELPGSLTLIDREKPSRVKVLLNNVRGKHFNAPNDVAVHPTSGYIFFTDPLYAQLQHFKSKPDVAPMTWAFSPLTGQLTPLDATGVDMPNGVAFAPDGQTLYVTDSSAARTGFYEHRADLKATVVYAFDVLTQKNEPTDADDTIDVTHSLRNRRIFAHVDTGIADGVKTDQMGNVYAGTGDGVDVWSPTGRHLLKVFLPFGGTPNIAFAGSGRLVALSDDKMWLIELARHVEDPGLFHRPAAGRSVDF